MMEEKRYRAGAEKWNWRQRLASNLVFGAAHIFNLYVPIGAVIALGSGGWWFMRTYRKTYNANQSRVTALEQSCAVHHAHNRLVIFVFLPIVIIVVVASTFLK